MSRGTWYNKGCPRPDGSGQLDDIQPGILLFPLLERTGDERYRKALELFLPVIKHFPRCVEDGFWHKQWCPEQMWLDGLYMAGPISGILLISMRRAGATRA